MDKNKNAMLPRDVLARRKQLDEQLLPVYGVTVKFIYDPVTGKGDWTWSPSSTVSIPYGDDPAVVYFVLSPESTQPYRFSSITLTVTQSAFDFTIADNQNVLSNSTGWGAYGLTVVGVSIVNSITSDQPINVPVTLCVVGPYGSFTSPDPQIIIQPQSPEPPRP